MSRHYIDISDELAKIADEKNCTISELEVQQADIDDDEYSLDEGLLIVDVVEAR